MTSIPLSVTLDTNACDVVHDPNKKADKVDPADAQKLRQAIVDGRVEAFVSQSSVFVECLSIADKLAYFGVAMTPDERPEAHVDRIETFSDMASIGVKMLHAPLIGAEIFVPPIAWADDVNYPIGERQKRFFAFIRQHPNSQPLKDLGEEISQAAGQRMPWPRAVNRRWDSLSLDKVAQKKFENQVRGLIGEWMDTLILASHYGYGNDYFCSIDAGKAAGAGSLMHAGNRANLAADGIKVVSPKELMALL